MLVFDFFYFLLHFRIVLISSRRSFCSIFSVLPYRDCTQVGYVYLYMYYLVFLGLHVDLITDNSMMEASVFTYLLREEVNALRYICFVKHYQVKTTALSPQFIFTCCGMFDY